MRSKLTFLAVSAVLALAGCGDDGQGRGETDEETEQPSPPGLGGPSGNDSDYDDGSYWPKWKNPCPGPACDPPKMDRDERINPPPYEREPEQYGNPAPGAPMPQVRTAPLDG
jgi:hypothetical protein